LFIEKHTNGEMIATISRWISIAGGSTLLIIGTTGALFNILVFSHRTLRSCSCLWYMLIAAVFDLITLDHALLLRILSDGFSIDPISLNTVYCKLRFYTGQIASFAPITLICLAAMDRWAVSRHSYLRHTLILKTVESL
jgi:maltodextrin utilization protein YvdJ